MKSSLVHVLVVMATPALMVTVGILLFLESFWFGVRGDTDSVLRSEVVTASAIMSEMYRKSESYIGLCESVRPILVSAEKLDCFDSREVVDLKAINNEEAWCLTEQKGVQKCLP